MLRKSSYLEMEGIHFPRSGKDVIAEHEPLRGGGLARARGQGPPRCCTSASACAPTPPAPPPLPVPRHQRGCPGPHLSVVSASTLSCCRTRGGAGRALPGRGILLKRDTEHLCVSVDGGTPTLMLTFRPPSTCQLGHGLQDIKNVPLTRQV